MRPRRIQTQALTANKALEGIIKRSNKQFKLTIDPARIRAKSGDAEYLPQEGLIMRDVQSKSAKIETDTPILHEADHAAGDLHFNKRKDQIIAQADKEDELRSLLAFGDLGDTGSSAAAKVESLKPAKFLGQFLANDGKSLELSGYDNFFSNDELRVFSRNITQQSSLRKQSEFIEKALGRDAVPAEMKRPVLSFTQYFLRNGTIQQHLDSAAKSIEESKIVKTATQTEDLRAARMRSLS